MILRVLIHVFLFLLVFAVQFGLISSAIPFVTSLPIILVIGVYLIQHESAPIGMIWIIGEGILLDSWFLEPFRISLFLAVLMAAFTMLYASRIFSNRSFYGVVGCGLLALLSIGVIEFIILGILWVQAPERIHWGLFLQDFWLEVLSFLLLIALFYPFFGTLKRHVLARYFITRTS